MRREAAAANAANIQQQQDSDFRLTRIYKLK